VLRRRADARVAEIVLVAVTYDKSLKQASAILAPTRRSTSPRRSSRPAAPLKVSASKSRSCSPTSKDRRNLFGVTDIDSAEATRAKIAGRLLLMDEGFREVLPILFDVFGVPDQANPAPAIDPEQRQKRLHGVVKRVLHDPAYSGERVLLLEDLHWFDGASDAFLETFVESVPAPPTYGSSTSVRSTSHAGCSDRTISSCHSRR
jgi:hypothetical protein